jgi:hypothetical protein
VVVALVFFRSWSERHSSVNQFAGAQQLKSYKEAQEFPELNQEGVIVQQQQPIDWNLVALLVILLLTIVLPILYL